MSILIANSKGTANAVINVTQPGLLIACFQSGNSNTGTLVTGVTGGGLTWTAQGGVSAVLNPGSNVGTVWTAYASTALGSITVAPSAGLAIYTNVDLLNSSAITAVGTWAAAASGNRVTASVTPVSINDYVYAVFAGDSGNETVTAGTTATGSSQNMTLTASGVNQYIDSETANAAIGVSATQTATLTGTAMSYGAMIALTVNQAPPPVASAPIFINQTENSIGVEIPALPTGTSSYDLYRAPDNAGVAGTFAAISIGATPSTTYTDSGLVAGTRYWYHLVENSSSGSTVGNNGNTYTLPANPNPLSFSPITSTSIGVVVPALSGGAVSYNLQRAPDNAGVAGTYAIIANGVTPNATYTDSALSTGTKYWYELVAVNSVGTSTGTAAYAITGAGAPTITAGPNYINVSGTPLSGAVLYNLYRSTSAGGPYGKIQENTAVPNWTDYAVSNGVVYYYEYSSINAAGAESGLSPFVSSTTLGTSHVVRATAYQRIQIKREVTPGLIVPATNVLHNMTLTMSPDYNVKPVKNPGSKVATDTQEGSEHTAAKWSSALDFNILTWVFCSQFGFNPPSPIGVTGVAWQWNWSASPSQPIIPQPMTIEQGSVLGGEKVGYSIFSDTSIKFSHEVATAEGTLFAQPEIRNITLTPSATEVQPRAVQPQSIGLYLSTDGGTTFNPLPRNIEGEIMMNGSFKPTFHTSDITNTYDDVVELMPTFGMTLTQEEGSTVDSFISNLKHQQKVYVGLQVNGPLIEAGIPNIYHQLKIQMPMFVIKPDPKDVSGVWGNTIAFECAYDNVFGMVNISLINKIAQATV